MCKYFAYTLDGFDTTLYVLYVTVIDYRMIRNMVEVGVVRKAFVAF